MLAINVHKILLSLSLLSVVNSLRILTLFPVPFNSHQVVFQALVEELASHGHELVVLTPLPHEKPIKNVTEIDVHDISYKLFDEGFKEIQNSNFVPSLYELFTKIMPTLFKIADAQFSTPEMQAIIHDKSQHFDVILVEATLELGNIFSHIYKAPIIQVSSSFGYDSHFALMGGMIHPFIFPENMLARYETQSIWGKLQALYVKIKMFLYMSDDDVYIPYIKKYLGENAPSMKELRQNIQMIFLNVHHIWDNNRPVPPSVVYMGGLHMKKPKPLPKDLQTFFDSSKNGVVYMSLGSKVLFSDLPAHIISVFLEVFASLPYDVLIKWNGGELPNKPANVRLQKWLPQNDMLHHPKLKAYIMQGGLQSTDEAIAAQVPLIALPVVGDQWYNAQKFVKYGIGKHFDITNLNAKDLREAILEIAEEKSYRDNIARLSKIMEEQRAGGLQKAVYWTEYVAKYGALHLRSPLADASLVDYFMLDVLGAIVLFIILLLVLVTILIAVTIKHIKRILNKSNVKQKNN